jgi:hypothetical protein
LKERVATAALSVFCFELEFSMSSDEHATQLIPDLSSDVPQYVSELLQKKLASGDHTPVETFNGADVYRLGDSQTGYIVLYGELNHGSGERTILYFVRFKRINASGLQKLGRQVLVWRDKNSHKSVGFAHHVFFDILLKEFHSLITDTQQTSNGQRFWMFELDHAFKNPEKYFVYFLDRRPSHGKLLQMKSADDLSVHSKDIWGTSEGHLRTHAIISTKPISLR